MTRFGIVVYLAAAIALLASGEARAKRRSRTTEVLGVPIPRKAIPNGHLRWTWKYRKGLKHVVKFYQKKLKERHRMVEAIQHPGAQVFHIKSLDAATAWEGINLAFYDGVVHILILDRKPAAP